MKLRLAPSLLLFTACFAFFGAPPAVQALGPMNMDAPEAISGCVMLNDDVWVHHVQITADTEITELARNNFDPDKWTHLGKIHELTRQQLEVCGSTIVVYYLSGQNGLVTVIDAERRQLGEVLGLLVEELQELQQSETTTAKLNREVDKIRERIIADYGATCCCRYTGGDPSVPATWLGGPMNEWACKNYSSIWTYQPLHCYGDPALAAAPASYTFSEKCASLHGY